MKRQKKKPESEFQWMKYVVIMAIVAVSSILLAIYALPFVAYYQVESAIMVKDTGKLASYTDFNEMKRNLKAQKGQRVIKRLKRTMQRINPWLICPFPGRRCRRMRRLIGHLDGGFLCYPIRIGIGPQKAGCDQARWSRIL